MTAWQVIQTFVAPIVSLVGGTIALAVAIRTWRLSRPKLLLTPKEDVDWSFLEKTSSGDYATLTFSVSNRSSNPNSILWYEIKIKRQDGAFDRFDVEKGVESFYHADGSATQREIGVTPLNLPANSTT